MLLYQILACTLHEKNEKMSYNHSTFKISAPTWNEKFGLPDGLYFVSDIQNYFQCILEKHGEKAENFSIWMYLNRTENRITFTIKKGY